VASRKEQKERLRREREERERAEAEAAARRKRLTAIGAAALAVVAVAVAGIAIATSGGGGDGGGGGEAAEFPEGSVPPPRVTELRPAAKAAGCVVRDFPDFGSGHTEQPVRYKSNPPTSGDHAPEPAEDRAYRQAPGTGDLVHSLEHGRILYQFSPSLPAQQLGDLKALFDEDPVHVILTPNATNMPYEVAATAWRNMIGCRKMNPKVFDALRAFKDRYRDRGPEFVP
jgi:hypothetical protein